MFQVKILQKQRFAGKCGECIIHSMKLGWNLDGEARRKVIRSSMINTFTAKAVHV